MADWNTLIIFRRVSLLLGCLLATAILGASACTGRTRSMVPAGTSEPDKFLFDKGTDALNSKKWLTAREFFKQVTETYTASPYRPDSKLGIGDTYLGEGTAEALVLAINEFREFLSFYPTSKRADYAQYKLAVAHVRQMRAPQRDQTETREAIKEFETFIARYPNSSLMPEVRTKLRETKDRLDESDYLVGYFYFRQRWYPGAIDRFKTLLKEDSEVLRARRRLLLPRRGTGKDEAGSGSVAVFREASAGIRKEPISPGDPQAHRRIEGSGANQVRKSV